MCVGEILFSVTVCDQLFCVIWLGRRRSGRLIASPWLYNWTKKKPEYVTIDDDGSSGNAPETVTGGSSLKKNKRGEASIKSPGEVATPVNRLDIRSEWLDAERMRRSSGAKEDDDFMTPQERFDSSGKKIAGQAGRKAGCSSLSAKSRVSTASIVKQLRSKVITLHHAVFIDVANKETHKFYASVLGDG